MVETTGQSRFFEEHRDSFGILGKMDAQHLEHKKLGEATWPMGHGQKDSGHAPMPKLKQQTVFPDLVGHTGWDRRRLHASTPFAAYPACRPAYPFAARVTRTEMRADACREPLRREHELHAQGVHDHVFHGDVGVALGHLPGGGQERFRPDEKAGQTWRRGTRVADGWR